jgi:hypothetical protein
MPRAVRRQWQACTAVWGPHQHRLRPVYHRRRSTKLHVSFWDLQVSRGRMSTGATVMVRGTTIAPFTDIEFMWLQHSNQQ